MPDKDKLIHKQTFEGGVNTDFAPDQMPKNQVRYMLNCSAVTTSEGQLGTVINQNGNSFVSTPLPSGENECIGDAQDEERNKFYFFVWNSNGFHTIFQYDNLLGKVNVILQSKRDSFGEDILKFSRDFLILTANVIEGKLLYWCDGLNPARKINIDKALDKSVAGYGITIYEQFTRAYKWAPIYAPVPEHVTVGSRPTNYIYGHQFKFAYYYVYDDGEKSHVSDWSIVSNPDKESYRGINSISFENNAIFVTLNTGASIVNQLVLLVKQDNLDWKTVETIDKKKIGLADGGDFVYQFYNDGAYSEADQEKVFRPYSFLPEAPAVQAVTENSMVYAAFNEGKPTVTIDAEVDVTYEDIYIDPATENQFNDPKFFRSNGEEYIWESGGIFSNGWRNSRTTLVVGSDVKIGNKFILTGKNNAAHNYSFTYTAKAFDDATSVANYFRTQLNNTSRLKDIQPNSIDGQGNVSFTFVFQGEYKKQGTYFQGYAEPVQFTSLKDTGVSKRIMKPGGTFKYGIIYEDRDGRKFGTYTLPELIVKNNFITQNAGLKMPIHTLSINHRPPDWAYYYQIVRTADLTYSRFIWLLVQKAIDVINNDQGEYIDLVVGSLFTYQKIHPNTIIKYDFKKGDRIRLVSKFPDGGNTETYYPFYETEILDYKTESIQTFNKNTSTTGNNIVSVDGVASADNIGSYIRINGVEKLITGVTDGNKYTLDGNLVFDQDSLGKTFPSYEIINRRGVIRIKKPYLGVEITDYSLIEVFTPVINDETITRFFYDFGKKFAVLNPTKPNRSHAGPQQDQNGTNDQTLSTTPAIIKIVEGDVYVRPRELPTTNNVPGANVIIGNVEDVNYSDYYESAQSNNGRPYPEDDGRGQRYFGSRFRFSNNYIEDTKINGLNDYDNSDREDYNDPHGNVKLIKYISGRLFVFKELRDCWIPVNESIIADTQGGQQIGLSSKLLNQIQYYSWEGGIGNNPESWFMNGTQQYHASANSGVFLRLSRDGIEPISSKYFFDADARKILSDAIRYKVKIHGGFERKNDLALWSIPSYKKFIFDAGFEEADWDVQRDALPEVTTFTLVQAPTGGTIQVINSKQWQFTPVTGFTGNGGFKYQPAGGGLGTVTSVCIPVQLPANRQTSWRPQESSYFCVMESGANTGNKGWATQEEFYTDNLALTGNTRGNYEGQDVYFSPVKDETTCPVTPPTAAIGILVVDMEDGDSSDNYLVTFQPQGGSETEYAYSGISNPV